jgi:tetratricopeptide (TPR) repeat protein
MKRPSQLLLIRLLLLAATLIAFGGLYSADFTSWDDPVTTASNPHLNPPTLSGLAYHWRTPEYGLYIPITYTGWWLIAQVAQVTPPDPRGISLNPSIFHLANVLLHALNALIVFSILRRILKRDWPAGIGALLFALHPVQVEPVAWISGMKDVLCGTFSLAAIASYLIFAEEMKRREAETSGKTRSARTAYVLGVFCFALAILSKPSAMVVPAILLVIDCFCERRSFRSAVTSLLPWFGLSIIAAISAKCVQPAIGIESVPLWARPLIVGDSLSFYLYKLLLPVSLGIDYGRRPQVVMHQPWLYVAWFIPLAIATVLWRWRKSRPMLLAAACIFVIALSPTLGWTRFLFQYYSTVADHYLYVAMLGPALALGWLLTRTRARAAYVLCGVLLIASAVLTWKQTETWKSDEALFTQAIAVNPKSFAGYNNLGHAYLSRMSDPREQPDLLALAARAFHDSIQSNPDYPAAHQNLALVLILHGEVDRAIDEIKTSLRLHAGLPKEIRGEFYKGYLNLARQLIRRGREREAVEAYQEYLKYAPEDVEAKKELSETQEQIRNAPRPATTKSD